MTVQLIVGLPFIPFLLGSQVLSLHLTTIDSSTLLQHCSSTSLCKSTIDEPATDTINPNVRDSCSYKYVNCACDRPSVRASHRPPLHLAWLVKPADCVVSLHISSHLHGCVYLVPYRFPRFDTDIRTSTGHWLFPKRTPVALFRGR